MMKEITHIKKIEKITSEYEGVILWFDYIRAEPYYLTLKEWRELGRPSIKEELEITIRFCKESAKDADN